MSNKHSKVCLNPGWNHLNPAWASTSKDLEEDFKIKYTGDGWYNREDDWMLIQIIEENQFFIRVWYGTDPRTYLLQIAGAEVKVFAGEPV